MRQKRALLAGLGVAVTLLGALVFFACERSQAPPEGGPGCEEREHAAPAEQSWQPALPGEPIDGLLVVEVAGQRLAFGPSAMVVRRARQGP